MENILPAGTIRLSPLVKTNDPRENKYWLLKVTASADSLFKHNFYETVIDEFNERMKMHCRVLSFSSDNEDLAMDDNSRNGYAHSRMWAQYAENHTGVCLLFFKKRLIETARSALSASAILWDGPVSYVNKSATHENNDPYTIHYSAYDSVDAHIRKYYKQLLLEKRLDWKDESEYRIVLYSSERTGDYFFIPIKDVICGVIVGVDFANTYNCSIREYCNKYKISSDHIQWQRGEPFLADPVYDYEYEHQR